MALKTSVVVAARGMSVLYSHIGIYQAENSAIRTSSTQNGSDRVRRMPQSERLPLRPCFPPNASANLVCVRDVLQQCVANHIDEDADGVVVVIAGTAH